MFLTKNVATQWKLRYLKYFFGANICLPFFLLLTVTATVKEFQYYLGNFNFEFCTGIQKCRNHLLVP